MAVDADLRRRALAVPGVVIDDAAHGAEHSIEVHLPFLTTVLGEVTVLPLVVGPTGAGVLGDVLEAPLGRGGDPARDQHRPQPLPRRAVARRLDERTAAMICRRLAPPPAAACGAAAVAGMLLAARRHRLEVRVLDVRNSADTVGDPARVVGYGAFAMFEPTEGDDAARSRCPATSTCVSTPS